MANDEVKRYAKQKGVYQWEIANSLNISEPTLTRKFRVPLNAPDEKRIKKAIDEIAKTKNQ